MFSFVFSSFHNFFFFFFIFVTHRNECSVAVAVLLRKYSIQFTKQMITHIILHCCCYLIYVIKYSLVYFVFCFFFVFVCPCRFSFKKKFSIINYNRPPSSRRYRQYEYAAERIREYEKVTKIEFL